MTLNIIHLQHREDRLDILQKELSDNNISDFKIWDGIIDAANSITGISKAHKQIVEKVKHERLSDVLICEDDIRFTAKGAFEFFISNKPDSFDLYLGSIYDGILKRDNSVEDFSGLTILSCPEKS